MITIYELEICERGRLRNQKIERLCKVMMALVSKTLSTSDWLRCPLKMLIILNYRLLHHDVLFATL